MTLLDDFSRWDSGDLTREALLDRHGGEHRDLAMILDLHERLAAIGTEPVPYRDSEWERLRDALPDRQLRKASRVSRLVARPLVAASMVVGLTGAAAAASPAVRGQVISTWHRIERTIGLDHADRPAAILPSATTAIHPTPAAVPNSTGETHPPTGTPDTPGGDSGHGGGNSNGNGGVNPGGDPGEHPESTTPGNQGGNSGGTPAENPGGGSSDNQGGSGGGTSGSNQGGNGGGTSGSNQGGDGGGNGGDNGGGNGGDNGGDNGGGAEVPPASVPNPGGGPADPGNGNGNGNAGS